MQWEMSNYIFISVNERMRLPYQFASDWHLYFTLCITYIICSISVTVPEKSIVNYYSWTTFVYII